MQFQGRKSKEQRAVASHRDTTGCSVTWDLSGEDVWASELSVGRQERGADNPVHFLSYLLLQENPGEARARTGPTRWNQLPETAVATQSSFQEATSPHSHGYKILILLSSSNLSGREVSQVAEPWGQWR